MNKNLQKKVDALSERIIDQAQFHVVDESQEILAETSQYHEALADLLEYIEDEEDPEAVKEVAKEFLRSTLEMKKATNLAFDLTIVKLKEMAK